jgi:hypothetical protein
MTALAPVVSAVGAPLGPLVAFVASELGLPQPADSSNATVMVQDRLIVESGRGLV